MAKKRRPEPQAYPALGLKDKIEQLKAEAEERRRAEADEENRQAAAARQQAQTAAAHIYDRIEAMVKSALNNGQTSVELYQHARIPRLVPECKPGTVDGELVKMLEIAGLKNSLWIDIDISGNFSTANRLMLTI